MGRRKRTRFRSRGFMAYRFNNCQCESCQTRSMLRLFI